MIIEIFRGSPDAPPRRRQAWSWALHRPRKATSPFLAELLVDGATRHRGDLALMLGEMAAHNNQRTKHIGAVRAAVEAEVDRLTPLLDDPDAAVRDGVAFVLSQCPKSKRRTLPKLRTSPLIVRTVVAAMMSVERIRSQIRT